MCFARKILTILYIVIGLCGTVYNVQATPTRRTFYWVESTAATLQQLKVRIDKQKGARAWASVTSQQLSQLRQSNAFLIIRENAELPLR